LQNFVKNPNAPTAIGELKIREFLKQSALAKKQSSSSTTQSTTCYL
jgi:hypothetical protein